MSNRVLIAVGLISLLLLSGCSKDEEKLPDRDEFMVLKTQLNRVQTALIAQDEAALDELLIPSLRDEPEGVVSLLEFVYGDQTGFELEGLVNYKIYYTLKKARIDCDISGVGSDSVRSATLTFELSDTLWLLKRWETGLSSFTDDSEADTN